MTLRLRETKVETWTLGELNGVCCVQLPVFGSRFGTQVYVGRVFCLNCLAEPGQCIGPTALPQAYICMTEVTAIGCQEIMIVF